MQKREKSAGQSYTSKVRYVKSNERREEMKGLLMIVQMVLSIVGCTLIYNNLGAGLLGTPTLEWWQVWVGCTLITTVTLPATITLSQKDAVDDETQQRVLGIISTLVVYALSSLVLWLITLATK